MTNHILVAISPAEDPEDMILFEADRLGADSLGWLQWRRRSGAALCVTDAGAMP